MKALIGITSYYVKSEWIPGSKFVVDHLLVSYPNYADSVERAGAVPVNLSLPEDMDVVKTLADRMDGFIFCGGEDVLIRPCHDCNIIPVNTGREASPRDIFEIELLREVVVRKKPILAICRGMQLLNVFYGGTLIEDISKLGKGYLEHRRDDSPFDPVHGINIKRNTKWEKVLGPTCGVNSLHHQAIDNLAKELDVVALSEDGIVEMVENPDYPFMVGVQWHPEMLRPWQAGLFKTFVEASGR